MSGCGAAFESKFWGSDLRVVIAEKAVIERSGATGEGLSAINCYMGQRYGWNTPEDFVKYVVNDMMGLAREDLVYDVGRHVDSSVHLLEEWGLPIWKKDDGTYERIGRWQIPIHGESIKPVTAEPARKAVGQENIYERVSITHLLTDANDPNRIAGAVGFGVRENKLYLFKAKAVIITTGGASNVFRPRSVNEGIGRTWYSVFATGSAYGLMIPVGTEMTQMEHRFVPTRFKDGYGPVGMWFQYFHARVTNALGEDYTVTRDDELDKYLPYGRAIPTPHPAAQPPDVPGHSGRPGADVYAYRGGDAKAGRRRPGQDGPGAGRGLGGLPGYDHRPGPDLGLPEHRTGGNTVGG